MRDHWSRRCLSDPPLALQHPIFQGRCYEREELLPRWSDHVMLCGCEACLPFLKVSQGYAKKEIAGEKGGRSLVRHQVSITPNVVYYLMYALRLTRTHIFHSRPVHSYMGFAVSREIFVNNFTPSFAMQNVTMAGYVMPFLRRTNTSRTPILNLHT